MSPISNKKSPVQQIEVMATEAGRRIDNFLLGRCKGVPRTRIYQMVRKGEVRVNSKRIRPDHRLQTGDLVRIPPLQLRVMPAGKRISRFEHESIAASILHEDADLLVLNKPRGMVVHGGTGRSHGAIDILRQLFPQHPDIQLVHRLDRDTSGCLLIAKTRDALHELHTRLRQGDIEKEYLAVLRGNIGNKDIVVDTPLRRDHLQGGERMVLADPGGKHAHTLFQRVQRFRQASLARVLITTGRTHQIRVHAASIGHPIAADPKYGDRDFNKIMRAYGCRSLCLHASRVSVPGYRGRATLHLRAPLPVEFADLLQKLDNRG